MPTYTDTTEQAYRLLPGHHRRADGEQPDPLDEPLKRYLSGIGDQLHDVVELIERLAHLDDDGLPASDLADPDLADARWLSWLAQLVGIDGSALTTPELRAAIKATGFRTASTGGLIEAVEATLTGTKRVAIRRHVGGDPWVLYVDTWAAETPDPDLTDAVAEAQRPAGVASTSFHRTLAGATYDDLKNEFGTYADLEAEFATSADMATYVPTY